MFLVGCPRSRTTVAQRVLSQACDLVTMPSTNWYLEHRSTRVLNGEEGWSRERARPFARDRIRAHIRAHIREATGVDLPAEFGLTDGLDRLAREAGAAGWLEKTPLHVFSIAEIGTDLPAARFVHLVRDPAGVVASLLRRARDNPAMIGRAHQSVQANDEAAWRACLRATLQQHGKSEHLVLDSGAFVEDPETAARQVAVFLQLPYRDPQHPDRVRAQAAATPSHRPWKADAAGPVRRITHDDDPITLQPLQHDTVILWQQARQLLGITAAAAGVNERAGARRPGA